MCIRDSVTSAVAASKGEADLAIGNVVGSNISNILLVLGLSAAISSVGVTAMNFVDIIVSLAATIIVFIVASTQRTIKKKEGIFLVIIYAFYMAYICLLYTSISLGVSKINVNTECQLSFAEATRKYIEAGKDLEGKGFDPRKLLAPGAEAIKATVKEKMELFGSVGKAE